MSTSVDDVTAFGVRLREARQRAGLNQRQLAFSGCSPAYVSRLEAGQRMPSRHVLRELARRLGVSEDYLTGTADRAANENQKLLDADIALRLDEIELAGRLYREVLDEDATQHERARALAGLGQLAFREGKPRDAVRVLEDSLAIRRVDAADDPFVADTLGRAYSLLGELDRAVSLFRRCFHAAEERGDRIEMIRFAVLLTFALEDRGAFDEAAELLAQTASLVEESQDPLLRARLYWSQSRLHTLRGEPELAARYARQALEILEVTEHVYYTGRAHQLLAHAELDQDRPEEALEILRKGWPLVADTSSELEQAQFRLEEARALAALGRTDEATSLAADVATVVAGADPVDAARAYIVLGDIFRDTEERARAREMYEVAVGLLEKNPNRYLAEAYAKLAELLEEEGRKDDALVLLKQAVRLTYDASSATAFAAAHERPADEGLKRVSDA